MNSPSTTARRSVSGVGWLLAATVVTGLAGYVAMWLVARVLGAAEYAVFGVFWSALFLVVGVLFGLQQEATRATAAVVAGVDDGPKRSSLWVFASVTGLAVAVIVLVTSFAWAPAALGPADSDLAWQIALGSGVNAITAVMMGMLAGGAHWRLLALVVALDGVLRLAGVAIAVSTDSAAAIAWAVVLPFGLTVVVAVVIAPRLLRSLARLPLTYRQLAGNSVHTVIAASATAVLINGFPLILSFFADPAEAAQLGALIFAITLTRAPILVPLMALQSFLVSRFTTDPRHVAELMTRILIGIAGVMVVGALVTWLWGSWALHTFVSPEFALPAGALVPLVVSSGFIGALCVTGPALLARGRHRAYALGWVVASVVAIGLLFVPIDIAARAALALSIGPICGIIWHLVALRRPIPAAA